MIRMVSRKAVARAQTLAIEIAICAALVAFLLYQESMTAFTRMEEAAETFALTFPYEQHGLHVTPSIDASSRATEPYRAQFLAYLASATVAAAVSVGSLIYAARKSLSRALPRRSSSK